MPKKGKKKAAPPPPSPTYEWKEWPLTRLEPKHHDLKESLEAMQLKRNEMQMDRDAVARFLDITKREVRDYELSIAAKEREMELMEDNHRVEVRVYEQKVKHLEYEHRNAMRRIGEDAGEKHGLEEKEHGRDEEDLRHRKALLRGRIRTLEEKQAEESRALAAKFERTVTLTREKFRKSMDRLRQGHDERLHRLQDDMELRRRVELREAEERKNQHLTDLMRNHERDFGKIKEFYNGITRKNVATIRDLRAQIQQLREKQSASQALMIDISEENRRLADPLSEATEEVLALEADLKDAPKDRLALTNVTSRLAQMEANLVNARRTYHALEQRFKSTEAERDALYESFEDAVRAVQRRAEYRNEALERRLDKLRLAFDARSAELEEAIQAAQLDPEAVRAVETRVDAAIDEREARIRETQFAIARVSKAHNDALRVFAAKLKEIGADPAELETLPIPSATTTAPAGLVARRPV